ncbi:MAG: alpha-amylase/4-alpha-glucanotransferase domain-containing protein [Candidatus Krumholzibacteriales bacterium]
MGEKVTFVLGIHNHQPVGNFDYVIEDAYQKSYLPFLEVMNDFPDIPFALHNSGILWDWFAEGREEYLEIIEEMVERSQVEILSAGYYEPILTVIPEHDRLGQLSRMNSFIRGKLNAEPRGCWLTERIWEPNLPGILAEAGIEFVIVDDAHFKSIGFSGPEMRTFFNSEDNGRYVKIFPIDEKLRYLIPFSEPEETISHLREVARQGENPVAVLADDGEKFGVWPGTHDLVYRRNWLRRFLDLLGKNSDWIEVSTFSRVIDSRSSGGMVYLPTASYTEMMEWALPLAARQRHRKVTGFLESDDQMKEFTDMVRGGFWRNFLVKYEESNWMHKRMLEISELVEDYGARTGYGKVWEEAVNHLYQAQCNCAYWHGLFGGLYLPHLRSAIYRHLIEAERIIETSLEKGKDYLKVYSRDLDGDGTGEVILKTAYLKLHFKAEGASLRELDIFSPPFNLTDILRRRREIYHDDVGGNQQDNSEDVVSIHQINRAKEGDLDKRIVYDGYQRLSFQDHFFPEGVDLDSFSGSSYDEIGDFREGLFSHRVVERKKKSNLLLFTREGYIRAGRGRSRVKMDKLVSADASSAGFRVSYSLFSPDSDLNCRFAVQNCLSLLAGDAPDRYFLFPDGNRSKLASRGELDEVGKVSAVDEWLGIEISMEFSPAAVLWRFPIETVSNSESGFESVYQGTALLPVWPLELKKGREENFEIALTVKRYGR